MLEWVDPPFTPGHWVPDLVAGAGGESVAGTTGKRSVGARWEDLQATAPDVVIVAPCGYHLEAAVEQARSVVARFPGVPVWAIDADGIVVRPGPRLIDGVEAIASVLHPDRVPPRPDAVRRVA